MSEMMVFVNLPTQNLARSTEFYIAIGATINAAFTNNQAACAVMSESIFFMLVTSDYLQTFSDKPVIDPHAGVGVITALSRVSREAVDRSAEAGVAAGGIESKPASDLGFMYSRQLEDPDGNLIEFVWMDPASANGAGAVPESVDSTEGQARLAGFGG